MQIKCPKCDSDSENSVRCSKVVRDGYYFRTSDGQHVQRYYCRSCNLGFSSATVNRCYRQKKRHKNELVRKLYVSLVSQRRIAFVLGINRKTVARKFLFVSVDAETRFYAHNDAQPKATEFEFDDLETFEHSKRKPLSVTIAVEAKTRRILGIEVSSMRCKGILAKTNTDKSRKDTRRQARRELFSRLKPLVTDDCLIKSDKNPNYARDVKEFFPNARYQQFHGKRGSLGGQGELKKVKFDPLFSLNHTCAMLRANVNRLIRKTWCTTKSALCLERHLLLYADFHNASLL